MLPPSSPLPINDVVCAGVAVARGTRDGDHQPVPAAGDGAVPAAARLCFRHSKFTLQQAGLPAARAWPSFSPWISLIWPSDQEGASISFWKIVAIHLLLWSVKMLGRVKMLSLLLIYQEENTGLQKSGQTPTNCFMWVTPTLIFQLLEALGSRSFTISQKNACWFFFLFNRVISFARELLWGKNIVMTKHVVWQGYLQVAQIIHWFSLVLSCSKFPQCFPPRVPCTCWLSVSKNSILNSEDTV